MDFEFGSDGVCLPKGAMVDISGVLANTLVDRHEECLPERFLDKAGSCLISDPASIGFSPFGIGRHVCPGRNFALAETKGALATLLRTFRVETISGVVPSTKYCQLTFVVFQKQFDSRAFQNDR